MSRTWPSLDLNRKFLGKERSTLFFAYSGRDKADYCHPEGVSKSLIDREALWNLEVENRSGVPMTWQLKTSIAHLYHDRFEGRKGVERVTLLALAMLLFMLMLCVLKTCLWGDSELFHVPSPFLVEGTKTQCGGFAEVIINSRRFRRGTLLLEVVKRLILVVAEQTLHWDDEASLAVFERWDRLRAGSWNFGIVISKKEKADKRFRLCGCGFDCDCATPLQLAWWWVRLCETV